MQIKENSLVFHKGTEKIYKVVAFQNSTTALLAETVNGEMPIGFYKVSLSDIKDIEPLASKLFKVGDRVVSKLSNQPLVGEVVGIEEATNKVLIKSDKIDTYVNRRLRYAYGVYEIEPYVEKAYNVVVQDVIGALMLTLSTESNDGRIDINKLEDAIRGINKCK